MKINIMKPAKVIMENRDSRHNYFGWPTVARLKNDNIAVAASGFRLGHLCPFGKTVMSISKDEGENYSLPTPIVDTVLDDRDGGLCAFGESGLIVTSFCVSSAYMKEHTKNHKDVAGEITQNYIKAYLDTVSEEKEKDVLGSSFKISTDNGVTFGPKIKSPISSPHGPVELQNGEVIWVGTANMLEQDSDKWCTEAHIIHPDGTMEKVGEIEHIYVDGKKKDFCEPYAMQLRNGKMICHLREDKQFTLWQSTSDDNGRTWTKPVRILESYGGAPSHIIEHSSGMLICAYGYRSTKPYGLKVMFSKDQGVNWEDAMFLYQNYDSPDLAYPSTIELKNGNLLTVFYARAQEEPPSVVWQIEWNFDI